MTFKFSNNGEGNLNASIGTGDTSITLESGDGATFPAISAGEEFEANITEGAVFEWITCTARAGDVLTVTRDPTSPQSFNAGAKVTHTMSGNMLNSFLQKGDYRIVTADPDGSLAANYFGEEVFHSVTGRWWKHTTGTTWQEMNYHV
jgi:hypothetical protein